MSTELLKRVTIREARPEDDDEWGVSAICLHVRRGAAGVVRMYQRRGFLREPAGDLELPSVFLEAYVLKLRG